MCVCLLDFFYSILFAAIFASFWLFVTNVIILRDTQFICIYMGSMLYYARIYVYMNFADAIARAVVCRRCVVKFVVVVVRFVFVRFGFAYFLLLFFLFCAPRSYTRSKIVDLELRHFAMVYEYTTMCV